MKSIYPYAGFWKRAIAFVIDSFVLTIPTGILLLAIWVPQITPLLKLAQSGAELSTDMAAGLVLRYFVSMVLVWTLCIVGGWLYSALMESSKYQATLGKMALGIKVVDENGQRISFARATGRYFAKMISGMTLYFGFYMAGFTQKRQALHDIIATTFVIDKKHPAGDELPALAFSKGGCAAGIIVAVAPILCYILLFIMAFFAALSQPQAAPSVRSSSSPTTVTAAQLN